VSAAATTGPAPTAERWRWLPPLLTLGGLLLFPAPAGLAPAAWRYFALFLAVIVALIVEPLPAAAVGFMGIALAAASRLVAPDPGASLQWAVSGFGNSTIWLVFSAFVFAMGYERTGLGRRVALSLVQRLGGRTLGLGYAILLADLVLAPFTPSNTARSAGTIYPIVRNIPPLYDSWPGETGRRIGGYVMWMALMATAISSSLFLTALAPNLLAAGMVEQGIGHRITLSEWVVGFAPAGLLLIVVMPWLIYRV
jgi:L-tartrate/succinate antiporter